jgi:hypothetical protein
MIGLGIFPTRRFDRGTALRRRVACRAALVRQRIRAKNEIHATLARCLLGRSPFTDLFGKEGRVWLGEQELGIEEQETVAGCLRQIDFLDGEVAAIAIKSSRSGPPVPRTSAG